MAEYSEAAHRGALILDDIEPDWYTKVDPEGIDMNLPWMLDGVGDVLAHVYSQEQDATDTGGYYIGLTRLGITTDSPNTWWWGLDLPATAIHWTHKERTDAYAALSDAWRREIATRSSAPSPHTVGDGASDRVSAK
jgi:hypothetical protein